MRGGRPSTGRAPSAGSRRSTCSGRRARRRRPAGTRPGRRPRSAQRRRTSVGPMPTDRSRATMPSLDGRIFDMVSSTASRVDPEAPTRFTYHEAEGVVRGDYRGDTVREGRFVAVRRGDEIDVSFVHALVAGGVVAGAATSRIEPDPDRPGALLLVEDFEADGEPQKSVCAEVDHG